MKKPAAPKPVAGDAAAEEGAAALAFLAVMWVLVELGHKKLARAR